MGIEAVQEKARLLELLQSDTVVVYKHSSGCNISRRTIAQVQEFAKDRPDVPVAMIDVVTQRELSDFITQELEVYHESPQAIVVKQGAAVWDASHFSIRAKVLSEKVG